MSNEEQVKNLVEFGLWIDDPWRLVFTDEYWESLVLHGVRTADLMIDSSNPRWDLQYTLEQIERFCELAIKYDIEAVVLFWPTPVMEFIDEAIAVLDRICTMGVAAIGLDTESTWQENDLDGSFLSLGDAADYFIKKLLMLKRRHDVRIELTTHMGHLEATHRATLTPHVDRAYFQPYTTRHDWRGREVEWNSSMSPGRRQRASIERLLKSIKALRDGKVKLGIGQALWDQKWPGHYIEDALDLAYGSTVRAGVTSIRGWSSKWLVGVRSHSRNQRQVSRWVKQRFGP